MAFTLKNTEKTIIRAVGVDSQGAEVVGATFAWDSSDTSVITLDVTKGTESATATTTGKPGTAVVTVTSGAASATFEISVTTGEVVSIVLTADTPSSRIVVADPAPASAPVETTDATPTPVTVPAETTNTSVDVQPAVVADTTTPPISEGNGLQ